MIIIYNCYGGTHSSVVSASIHLKILAKDRIPTASEILSLPHFDQFCFCDHGKLFYFGSDEAGNKIFILGREKVQELIKKTILSVYELLGENNEQVIFVDALKPAGIILRIGGILSRKFGLIRIGRPLAVLGVRRSFYGYVHLVEKTKKEYGIAD